MRNVFFAVVLSVSFAVPVHAEAWKIEKSTAKVNKQPCPATGKSRGACHGWVIDHKKALACGGDDAPHNMQWQTTEEAKAKDKWERRGCRGRR